MKPTPFVAVLVLIFDLALSACAHAVNLKEVEEKLTTTGVEGEVHGASPEHGLFVFTYRNPTDFFDFVEMSLVSFEPEITKTLGTLNRHDRVRVKGAFLNNPSPQKHIEVTSVEMVKKFKSPYPIPPYEYEGKVPKDLLNKTTGTFLIHAVHSEGHILVVEYKDVVLPIFVRNGALTKTLFRGDLVQLSFHMQAIPDQPTHLVLNESAPQPLQVLESVQAMHGKTGSIEGALILFPKSPEILFNVFAVLQELPEGLRRQFTLVNFENPEAFAKLRATLQKAWDKYPGAYVNGRNKLVSTRIRVKATGTFNEVDASQANPQVLLNSLDSLEIIEKP